VFWFWEETTGLVHHPYVMIHSQWPTQFLGDDSPIWESDCCHVIPCASYPQTMTANISIPEFDLSKRVALSEECGLNRGFLQFRVYPMNCWFELEIFWDANKRKIMTPPTPELNDWYLVPFEPSSGNPWCLHIMPCNMLMVNGEPQEHRNFQNLKLRG